MPCGRRLDRRIAQEGRDAAFAGHAAGARQGRRCPRRIANDKDIADAYVLAADTIVAVGRRILVKPRFVEEAVAALQLLSGRSHRVLTGLCLIAPDDRVRLKIVDTRVRFKRLSKEEIEAYIASREWRGKAGGYAIQGLGRMLRAEAVWLLHQCGRAAADGSGQECCRRRAFRSISTGSKWARPKLDR